MNWTGQELFVLHDILMLLNLSSFDFTKRSEDIIMNELLNLMSSMISGLNKFAWSASFWCWSIS